MTHRKGTTQAHAEGPVELAARTARALRLADLTATVLTILLLPALALAQQPGGTIFGSDPTTAGEGVRQFVRWLRNILFLVGVAGVGIGCLNYMRKKEWGTWMGGGALCMGFGVVASFAYSLIQGNPIDVNTDLGQ